MEIIVGIAVVAAIGYLIFRKPEPVPEGLVAPYKVETPEAKVEEVNSQPVAKEPTKRAPAKAKAPSPAAKKPVAAKKAPATAKKPVAAKKAPAKKAPAKAAK